MTGRLVFPLPPPACAVRDIQGLPLDVEDCYQGLRSLLALHGIAIVGSHAREGPIIVAFKP